MNKDQIRRELAEAFRRWQQRLGYSAPDHITDEMVPIFHFQDFTSRKWATILADLYRVLGTKQRPAVRCRRGPGHGYTFGEILDEICKKLRIG